MKSGRLLRSFAACFIVAAALPAMAVNAATVNPSSLSFGNQALNSTSTAQTTTLTNNQSVALTISMISLSLTDYSNSTNCPFAPKTLAAGASCTISVFFTPTVTGLRPATLVILTDSGVNPMVSLTGTGVLAVVITPATLTFGSAKLGASSPPQQVTLSNNQSTALTISSISSNLSDFQVSSTCPVRPKTLAAGASCTTSLIFKPTATGTRAGTLTFVDNASNNPQVVSLIGTGSASNLLSIAVNPPAASVGLGATEQFSAVGTYSDHSTQNLTLSATWTSASPTTATVSAGLASTVAQGTVYISAASGTISGAAKLTVTAPTLVSIALTPSNPSLTVGMTQQLTAIGTYTDGSTQDLTGSVAWSSTTKTIASVSTTGMVTANRAGQTAIKGVYNSVTGTTQVSVVPSTVAYYVSTTGNDSNPGTLALPLATPQKAESLVMANYLGAHCPAQKAPIIVQFRGGTWTNLALNFTSADSGCSGSAPVVFENYPGETPVFSGGVRVTKWVNTSSNMWQTTLPANTVNFEALYYNGVRRQRPRLGSSNSKPLGTYYRVAGNVTGYNDRFYYNPSDPITTKWKNYAATTGNLCGQPDGPPSLQGDIQVAVFEQWDVSWQRISCIDTTNHLIYLTGSTDTGTAHGYIPTHRYLIENARDTLGAAGQWFLDRSKPGAWVLSYLAKPGENPNFDTVIIPQQPQVMTATGLQYRSFYGLTFSHDNYVVSLAGYPGSQSELMVPAAVQCADCSYVTFDSNSFTNIEGYGLSFPTDNLGLAIGDMIQNNALWDIGAGGILTGRIPSGAENDTNVFQFGTIQNNLIQGIGRKFPGSAGIANLLGHDVSTMHNDVTDGYSDGIMICFPSFTSSCQGTANSGGGFNQSVTFNHIWNLGQGILNDFGAVYLATYNATGDTVVNNKIHDLSDGSSQDSDGYGGNGFYIDRGGPIEIGNNLVYRTNNAVNITMGPPSTGQMIGVSNNIFAFTRKSIINTFACAQSGYSQFNFSSNIFLQDRTSASTPSANLQNGSTYLGNPLGSAQNFSSNDYWNTTENFATDPKAFNTQPSTCQSKTYYTLPNWQALGEDISSLSVTPGFTSAPYPNDNYTFLTGPPNIGFVPFNTTGACPNCPGRSNPLINVPTVPAGFPTAPLNPATDY